MSDFSLQRRGERSFRVRVELGRDPATGRRRFHLETVRGGRTEAVKDVKARAKGRAFELLDKIRKGEHVEHSTATVETYLRSWLDAPVVLSPKDSRVLCPKTIERYRQIAGRQIYPHLGHHELQKLGEHHIQDWLAALIGSGGKNGKPLSAQTVKHAHRLLHTALRRAMIGKKVPRNVAGLVNGPKVDGDEVVILAPDQIAGTLDKIKDHALFYPTAVIALGCGLRRGEVLALAWENIDLDGGMIRVTRSLGEAGGTTYFKVPKSKAGKRSVDLAPVVIEALKAHRLACLERRMKLGQGKLPDDALVFSTLDGGPLSPDQFSRDWSRLVKARGLPPVSFHALRHSNVSMLVAAGLDVVQVAKKIGHGNPNLTLSRYAHLFERKDTQAVAAIEAALTR